MEVSTISMNNGSQFGEPEAPKSSSSSYEHNMKVEKKGSKKSSNDSLTSTAASLQSLLPWVGNLNLTSEKRSLPFEDESPIVLDDRDLKLCSNSKTSSHNYHHHCRPPLPNGRRAKNCHFKSSNRKSSRTSSHSSRLERVLIYFNNKLGKNKNDASTVKTKESKPNQSSCSKYMTHSTLQIDSSEHQME